MKILIVARGGQTGTGKTTLAVHICQFVHSLLQCPKCRYKNEHGEWVGGFFTREHDICPMCGHDGEVYTNEQWSSENAYIDVWDYLFDYEAKFGVGDAALLDEAEQDLDSRRSMGSKSVTFSKYWSAMRYKNVVSVVTMPSTLQIDKRLEQLADILINVQYRGHAKMLYLWLNDERKAIQPSMVRNEFGQKEEIEFGPLTDDPAYLEVSKMKDTYMREGGEDVYKQDDVDDIVKDKERTLKSNVAVELSKKTDLSQREIGNIVDKSQGWVSNQIADAREGISS